MSNRKIVAIVSALLIVAIFSAISQSKGFKDSYNKSFKISFKRNFLVNCIGSDKSPKMAELCNCIADESLKQLTVKELSDQDRAQKYIDEHIVPQCIENNGHLLSEADT